MEESEKFIAFLDILGFKDLVNNNSHSDLMKKVNNLLLTSIERALSNGHSKIVERNGEKHSIADIDYIKIHSLTISDSVMFWTDNCTLESFLQITGTVHQMLESSFFIGLPMRGAISQGNLSFANNNFSKSTNNFHTLLIGKGLVDAYNRENKQEWMGCVVDEKCVETLVKLDPKLINQNDWFLDKRLIIKYKTPYKSGNVKEEYVIRWTKENESINEESIRKAFARHNKKIDDWNVELKIQNTIKFVEHCQKLV